MATHIIRPLSAMTQSLILGAQLSPCVFVGVGWPLQLLDKGKSWCSINHLQFDANRSSYQSNKIRFFFVACFFIASLTM